MNTFTQGEKVALVTSPILKLMTITKINDNGTYHCQFEDEKHHVKEGDFVETLLKKYTDPTVIYRL